jgi:hypothetical protein
MQPTTTTVPAAQLSSPELLALWVDDFARGMREEIGELSPEALAWQPRPQSNGIGVTVWHCARWLDVITAQALRGLPADQELWHTQGWAARTGYDPRGHGQAGLGAITGYTWDEVLEIPLLPAADLLAYLDQAAGALAAQLRTLTPEQLQMPAPGFNGRRSVYRWVAPFLQGCFGHLGEVEALKAWQAPRVG